MVPTIRIDHVRTEHGVRGAARRAATLGRALATAAFLVFATSCAAPIRVNTMTAPNASFATRPTWAWSQPPGGLVSRSVAGQYIQQAVAQQLAAKGYQMTGDGQPGFLVDYRVILRPEASLEGFGGGWGGGTLQTVHFTRGMLLVAATDPATGNALWQGMASTVIDPEGMQADDVSQINDAVAKMFQTFPAR